MVHEFEPLSGRILEAAVAVHMGLRPGFLESVYQKAMELALRHRQIAFQEQRKSMFSSSEEDVGLTPRSNRISKQRAFTSACC